MAYRAESTAAQDTGNGRAAKARGPRPTGVFKTLVDQHREARALLRRIKAEPRHRTELWPTLRAELTAHDRAELAIVYPALHRSPVTRALAEGHDRDAMRLTATIEQLHAMDISAPRWGEVLDTLIELVDHHVMVEETALFPQALDVLGVEQAKALDKPFLAACANARHALGVDR